MSRHQRTRIKNITAVLTPREVDGVLSKVCIKLGLCIPSKEQARIAAEPPSDIDEFTKAIFVAEGLSAQSDTDLYNAARDIVARAFVDHTGA